MSPTETPACALMVRMERPSWPSRFRHSMVALISAWRRTCGSWRSKRGLRAARAMSGDAAQPPAAEVGKDFPRRVVSGRAGHAAARMGAGATHVQSLQRPAVVAVAEHGARREQLVEAQLAVEDIP